MGNKLKQNYEEGYEAAKGLANNKAVKSLLDKVIYKITEPVINDYSALQLEIMRLCVKASVPVPKAAQTVREGTTEMVAYLTGFHNRILHDREEQKQQKEQQEQQEK